MGSDLLLLHGVYVRFRTDGNDRINGSPDRI